MTRKELVKHWDIIKEFKNGAHIERKSALSDEWLQEENPSFNYNTIFRIKPTSKIVPFAFDDAEFLICKVVKSKTQNEIFLIAGCDDNSVIM